MSDSSDTDQLDPDNPDFYKQLQQLLGPSVFGWCFQLVLCGLSTMFAFNWWTQRRGETRKIKALVAVCVAFNLVAAGLGFAQVYRHATYVDESAVNDYYYYTPEVLEPLPIAVVGLLTQGYLGYRTYKILRSNKLYLAITAFMIFASASCAIVLVVLQYISLGRDYDYEVFVLYQVWLWLMCATDIQIATVLTVSLRKLQTGFNTQTDDVISRLLRTAFQCCLLPTFFSVAAAIMYAITFSLSVQQGHALYVHALANCVIPALPSLHLFSLTINLFLRPVRPKSDLTAVVPVCLSDKVERDLEADPSLRFPISIAPELSSDHTLRPSTYVPSGSRSSARELQLKDIEDELNDR